MVDCSLCFLRGLWAPANSGDGERALEVNKNEQWKRKVNRVFFAVQVGLGNQAFYQVALGVWRPADRARGGLISFFGHSANKCPTLHSNERF